MIVAYAGYFITCLVASGIAYALAAWVTYARLLRLEERIEARQLVLDTAIGLFRAEVHKAHVMEVKRNRDV